jgi:hypothetical protein
VSTARTDLRDKIADALRGLVCEHDEHIHACPECAADTVLAALDLDARDARVRAETLREHAASMREKAHVLPMGTDRATWPWTGYLTAAKHAEQAADEIAPAGPSSGPVDAPSRPTGEPVDVCGRCELLPTTTGWVRATQVDCPQHGSRPAGTPGSDNAPECDGTATCPVCCAPDNDGESA